MNEYIRLFLAFVLGTLLLIFIVYSVQGAQFISGGDNLGNHTATKNLNLNGKDLYGVNIATITGSEFSVGTSTFVVKGGNIGIGTINPISLFHLRSSGQLNLDFDSGANNATVYSFRQAGAIKTQWVEYGTRFGIFTNAGYLEALTIRQTDGKVGINTSEPTHKLDVNGGAIVRSSMTVVGDTFVSTITITGRTKLSSLQLGDASNFYSCDLFSTMTFLYPSLIMPTAKALKLYFNPANSRFTIDTDYNYISIFSDGRQLYLGDSDISTVGNITTTSGKTITAKSYIDAQGGIRNTLGDISIQKPLDFGGLYSIKNSTAISMTSDGTVDGRNVSKTIMDKTKAEKTNEYIYRGIETLYQDSTTYIDLGTEIVTVNATPRGNYWTSFYYDVYLSSFALFSIEPLVSGDTFYVDWTAIAK